MPKNAKNTLPAKQNRKQIAGYGSSSNWTSAFLKLDNLINMAIGLLFVCVVVLSFFLFAQMPKKTAQSIVTPQSPQPTKAVAVATPTIPLNPIVHAQPKTPVVKKLPFTASSYFTYAVREGDSLAKIGMEFCSNPRAYLHLADINNISAPYTLHFNQKISVECQ